MNQYNGISIVIATKGRVKLLEELLASVLITRNNFSGESEVILVDDSNSNDVREIEMLCNKYSAKRVFHSPSVSEKRNIGAKIAKFDIVLFLDSDCIATPNLLNEHRKLYTEEKIGGVAGLLEFIGEDTFFWKAVHKSPFVISFEMPLWVDSVPWTPAANCSVRKDVFEQIGGFDSDFQNKPGGEDVDFGIRINKKGYVLKCTKEGLVYHSKATWAPVKDMLNRIWNYGIAGFYIIDKHSDMSMEILPGQSIIAIILLFFSIIIAFINPWFLLLLPLWIFINNVFTALMINICFNKKKATFLEQLIIQKLINIFELSYMFHCILKRKLPYIFRDIVYYEGQMNEAINNYSVKTWCNTITLTIISLIVIMFL